MINSWFFSEITKISPKKPLFLLANAGIPMRNATICSQKTNKRSNKSFDLSFLFGVPLNCSYLRYDWSNKIDALIICQYVPSSMNESRPIHSTGKRKHHKVNNTQIKLDIIAMPADTKNHNKNYDYYVQTNRFR